MSLLGEISRRQNPALIVDAPMRRGPLQVREEGTRRGSRGHFRLPSRTRGCLRSSRQASGSCKYPWNSRPRPPDVLKVISRSALDVQKVLDALVESAARLCNAYDAAIYQVDGSSLRLVAHHGNIPFPAPIGHHKRPHVCGFIAGRAVIERRTNHIADMQAEAEDYAEGREVALRLGVPS